MNTSRPLSQSNKLLITCRTPSSQAWGIILASAATSTETQALKALVSQYSDPLEDLRRFQFTAIHLIVLGLSPINLSEQLQLDTSEIDVGDSTGKTPLMWAVQRGDKAVVQILLKFGARLDIRTIHGPNVFSLASNKPDISMLRILVSAIDLQSPCCHQSLGSNALIRARSDSSAKVSVPSCDHRNLFMKSLLDCPDYDHGTTALHDLALANKLTHAKFLLAHGASVNAAAKNFALSRAEAPLLYALEYNSHEVVKLLLNAGAKTDVRDTGGHTIIHIAARQGDMKTIRILRKARLCCLSISTKNFFGKTALEEFDTRRSEYRSEEDEETRQKCRKAFVKLLESINEPGSDHVCAVRGPPNLDYEVAEEIDDEETGSIYSSGDDDNKSVHSDYDDHSDCSEEDENDEFFDARSTFDE